MSWSAWARRAGAWWIAVVLGSQASGCYAEATGDTTNDDDGDGSSSNPTTAPTTSMGTTSASADTTTSGTETVDPSDTLDDSSSTTGESSTTDEGSTTDGVDCSLPIGMTWDDDFERPDANDLGNCWVEKSPAVWQVVDSAVSSEGEGATAYFDHIVWREDLITRNVEIKLEIRFRSSDLRNEPHPMARMTEASLQPGAFYHGYALIPHATDGVEPMQLCLMRFDGGPGIGEQRCENLVEPLELGPTRYRLVLNVEGPGPVYIDGRLDVLREGDFDWSPALTLEQWVDSSPDQIHEPGAVGFSGGTIIDVLDNYAIDGMQLHHLF
jgi:hypothetical protein